MTKLEQEVLDIINETIEGKYIGKLRVLVDNNIYQLFLYLDRELTPMIFGCEGTEDEFKDFIRREFKSRKLERIGFYKIVRKPIVLNEWDDE